MADWLKSASAASTDEKAYHITVELPGVFEEDVGYSVNNGYLIVHCDIETESEKKGRHLVLEREGTGL